MWGEFWACTRTGYGSAIKSDPVSATESSHPWMYLNKPSIIFPVLGPSHLCCPLLGPWGLRPTSGLLPEDSPGYSEEQRPPQEPAPSSADAQRRAVPRALSRAVQAETGPLWGRSCRWRGLPLSLAGLPGPRAGGRMACAPPPPFLSPACSEMSLADDPTVGSISQPWSLSRYSPSFLPSLAPSPFCSLGYRKQAASRLAHQAAEGWRSGRTLSNRRWGQANRQDKPVIQALGAQESWVLILPLPQPPV